MIRGIVCLFLTLLLPYSAAYAAAVNEFEIGKIDSFGLFSSSSSGMSKLAQNGGAKIVNDSGGIDAGYVELLLKANRRLFSRKVSVITVRGAIVRSDVKKIRAIIEKYGDLERSSRLFIAELSSKGGQTIAGIELGELFSQHGVATFVGADSQCKSACAVAFMGGTFLADDGQKRLARGMHPNAQLGFHAPFGRISSQTENAKIVTTMKEVLKNYHNGIKQIGEIISRSGTNSSSWSPELLGEMLAKGKDEFFFIDTIGKSKRYKIPIILAGQTPTLLDPDIMSIEHILSTCLFELMINSKTRGGIVDASKNYREMTEVLKDQLIPVTFEQSINQNVRDLFLASYGATGQSCLIGSAKIALPDGKSIYHLVGSTAEGSQRMDIQGPLMDQNLGDQVIYGTPSDYAAPFNLSLKVFGDAVSNCNRMSQEISDKHYEKKQDLTEAAFIGVKSNRECYIKTMAELLEDS